MKQSYFFCLTQYILVAAECSDLVTDKTHFVQLINKMKGIRTLSIPSRNQSESPLVRCDNMVIARKVSDKYLSFITMTLNFKIPLRKFHV